MFGKEIGNLSVGWDWVETGKRGEEYE